jgi:parallel beta-helix repeat protein
VQCGDTIGPNQTVTLQENLYCDDNPGLTVIGPAEVHLNGHTIHCTNPVGAMRNGLFILGKKAKVHGGIIDECLYGVYVEGQGHHTVEDVAVVYNFEVGFLVGSDKNTLRRNETVFGRYGFVVRATGNILLDNSANRHGKDGFVIDGNKHQLLQNLADENDGDGFSIYGVGHKLTENVARYNSFDGFDLQEGHAKKITLHKNLALNNGQDGFQISGKHHKVLENEAKNNAHDGIQVHEANNIKLIGNVVLDNNQANYPTILFDLKDLTPNCDTNTWKKNTFGTASQPCIQ